MRKVIADSNTCMFLFRKSNEVTVNDMLPDMDLAYEMSYRKIRVQDVLDALRYMPVCESLEDFMQWYCNREERNAKLK